jgi:hypothetical protein
VALEVGRRRSKLLGMEVLTGSEYVYKGVCFLPVFRKSGEECVGFSTLSRLNSLLGGRRIGASNDVFCVPMCIGEHVFWI